MTATGKKVGRLDHVSKTSTRQLWRKSYASSSTVCTVIRVIEVGATARYVKRLRIEAIGVHSMLAKFAYWSSASLLIGSLSITIPAVAADLDAPPAYAGPPRYAGPPAPPPPPPYAYYYPPRVYAYYPFYGPYFGPYPWGGRPWYRGWGRPGWAYHGWGHRGWRR
jgi:hypothetical protein